MEEDKIQNVIDQNAKESQFTLAPTDYHTHNGSDSPQIDFKNLTNRVPLAQSYVPAAGITQQLDLLASNLHFIQMPAGNITISLINDILNQVFLIDITQDSVGSRTVTWFNTIRWMGGSAPVLTTTANKRDSFGFIRTGISTYDGYVVGQNI